MSIPGAAAQRAAQVAGPDLGVVRAATAAVVQRAEDRVGAVRRVDRQVRAGDVADEQRVAGQDGPGLVAAVGVDQREGGVLGPVAGRVQGADA